MDALLRDLRSALRSLRKSSSFTLAVVLTLALCIGATTSIFSVVHAVLFRPLPFTDPGGILWIRETWRGNRGSFSVGNWADTRRADRLFQHLVPMRGARLNLATEEAPENVNAARVGWDFFSLLGVTPALGRVFRPEEDQPGRDNVVVLTDGLWRSRFGADRGIIGRQVRLDGRIFTVIGVMPPSLDYAILDEQLWVPNGFTPEQIAMHDEHYLIVLGRLKPGVTRTMAQSELTQIATWLREHYPKENQERGITFSQFDRELVRDYRPRLLVLLGAVGFVLLIACANIANLLLARGATRAREMAIRAAIGAGRGHLIRQALVECLILATAGGVAGLLVAVWGADELVRLGPADIPRLALARIDAPVLAFAAVLTLVSGLIFGLAPALRAATRFPQDALKEGGRTGPVGGRDQLRHALVVGEIALALVLLTGAGLLIRTAVALNNVDPGFNPNQVLAGRVSLPASAYSSPDQISRAFSRIAEELERAPRAEATALVSTAPLEDGFTNGLVPEGRPYDVANAINAMMRLVSPDYLRTMGIALKRGRNFTAQDRADAPKVMLINETLAREAFPGQDPLGKRIACCEAEADSAPSLKEVVGVVTDTRAMGLSQDPSPEFYLPLAQAPKAVWGWMDRTMTIAMRTQADPHTAAGVLRRSVSAVDPNLAVFNIGTMDDRITASLSQSRFSTMLLTAFGAIALLLAAIGVYGIISYGVTQRTQEIGIRMALGAQGNQVLGMMVRHGAALAALGLGIGLIAALTLTRLLSTLLFQVSPTDPPTFATGAIVLSAVALLAVLLPARRAARVDPLVALRYE
jgi:putative ABC transport system permease protein